MFLNFETLISDKGLWTCASSPQGVREVGATKILILLNSKLKLPALTCFAQGRLATRWEREHVNPKQTDSRASAVGGNFLLK